MVTPVFQEIREWSAEGLTLLADDHGQISLDALREFLRMAQDRFPDSKIMAHKYGLRVLRKIDPWDAGPKLRWEDWD